MGTTAELLDEVGMHLESLEVIKALKMTGRLVKYICSNIILEKYKLSGENQNINSGFFSMIQLALK